jgi:hypothetical protein
LLLLSFALSKKNPRSGFILLFASLKVL